MRLTNLLSILGVLAWVAYELLLRRREDSGTADWHGDAGDQGSTRLLVASYVAAVALNVGLSFTSVGQAGTAWRWIGVAMIAAGLALRAWGMTTLGRFYTRTLRTVDEQRVVTDGPYQWIRHPGYTGSLLVWTGYSLGLGNWIALLVVAALLVGAYTWRINAEEKLLVDAFGDRYTEYRHHTRRLVPFLY